MRDVAVIGIGTSQFGKFPDRPFHTLGAEAVRKALSDAAIAPARIQVAYGSRIFLDQITAQVVLRDVGIAGIEMINVENACAGGATAVRCLWKDIATGVYDIGLAFGVESMTTSPIAGKLIAQGEDDIDAKLGSNMPVVFALMAKRLMETHGATAADFAQVSVKSHQAAALNPAAQYRKTLTVGEVLESRLIADPITLLQCCPNTDGAAAVVMCPLDMARTLGGRPVRVLASVLQSSDYFFRKRDLTSFDAGRSAAARAYEMAGLGPEDLDVVELHDAFAPEELVHYEDLGLCRPGDSVALLRSGATSLGGRVPVNPSGGLLSLGHPLSASGVRTVCDVVQQLRGEAGPRQKEGARIGLAQMLGGNVNGLEMGAAAIHIMARD
ncbi:MAG: thiolase family protein [Alphaproteobacteria bacterium]|nr:thiolase family protein [Alphaproteobacteria bacterium]